MKEETLPGKSVVLLPAVLLITVQFLSGMRDLPQLAFFVIYLEERLHLSSVTISGVVAGAQLAGMLAALLGGPLAARLGSRRVLTLGLALSGLGSLAFQAAAPALVSVLWLTGGAGMALTTVGGASYLTRISRQGGLGILAAFYALSMTAGGALGNPLAGLIIERYGYSPFSWAAVALAGAAVLLAGLVMRDLPDRVEGAVVETVAASARGGVLTVLRLANARYLVVLRALPTIFYGMLSVLIPLLLNQLSGSKVLIAAYGTTNLVVASAAQLLVGRSADRWGARGPTLAAYSVMILSGLCLAAASGTVWGLFTFGVLGIAAAWSLSTLMYVWVSDGITRPEQPATFGLLHAVWSLSMMTGSMLAGSFAASLPALPFLIAGLMNVASLVLIRAYYRGKTRRLQAE